MTVGIARVVALALVATVTGCGRAPTSCRPISLRVEPVALALPPGTKGHVDLVAHVEVDGAPHEGVRVVFHGEAVGSDSGQYLGDTRSNERGVARVGNGYIPSVDRERYLRMETLRAGANGSRNAEGGALCSAEAEAPFTFRET